MTVFKNNPLLMTVMGANPGPRRKRPVDDPVDRAIGQIWARLMSGVQVPIMEIPRIFRDIKLEVAGGMSIEEAVMRVGQRFQVNPRRLRRNPSLGASLAGGMAGAFVTHALSNPGPAFIVIDSKSGVVQYRKAASGMGTEALNACLVRAKEMASELKRPFLVFLDMQSFKIGTSLSLPMVRMMGATEVRPDGGSGRANPNGYQHVVAGIGNYYRVVARWKAKGGKRWVELYQDSHGYGYKSDNGGGYLGNLGSDDAAVDRMQNVYGPVTALKSDFPSTKRTLNPQGNPGPSGGKRKVTMTIEKFAQWVKAKRDPAMWKAFLAKFRGYEKWTHGAKSRKVTLEWQNVPGMSGLWITYDGGKQPESTYIMPSGSPRKGAWKHPWDTMPDINHDPEAGVVLTKLRGKSRITDFYHK